MGACACAKEPNLFQPGGLQDVRQGAQVGDVAAAIAGQVKPQPPQRVQRDAVVGGAARIIWVIHKAALAGNDFLGQCLH